MGKQLELDVNAFMGLTDWFGMTGETEPIRNGWYNVRFKMSDEERAERKPEPMRRWYQIGWGWSRPLVIGSEMSQLETHEQANTPASVNLEFLEWQGLLAPHPDLLPVAGEPLRDAFV